MKCCITFFYILSISLFSCEENNAHQSKPSPDKASLENPPTDLTSPDPGTQPKTKLLFLTAQWCQWCKVMKHEVLPNPKIKAMLSTLYHFEIKDVDEEEHWMDLPGIKGLPSFLFYDVNNKHVLSKSGYQSVEHFSIYLSAAKKKILAKKLAPYPRPSLSILGKTPITKADAEDALKAFEQQLFFKINSNRGGFNSPSAHPRPHILLELSRWTKTKHAPPRVRHWIELTMKGAMRGSSPFQKGEPLPDMDFSTEAMKRLSQKGYHDDNWRKGIDTLATKDPYLGLLDFDGGFFRYAAGPGWYNPHFERLADENLAWVYLLESEGMKKQANKTWRWFNTTFLNKKGFYDLAQESNPFYYRLSPQDRKGVPIPKIKEGPRLSLQALTLSKRPQGCRVLINLLTKQKAKQENLPDTLGEILMGLNACKNGEDLQRKIADNAVKQWKAGLPANARLHRLAGGLCSFNHPSCGAALNAAVQIDVHTKFAPPMVALELWVDRPKP